MWPGRLGQLAMGRRRALLERRLDGGRLGPLHPKPLEAGVLWVGNNARPVMRTTGPRLALRARTIGSWKLQCIIHDGVSVEHRHHDGRDGRAITRSAVEGGALERLVLEPAWDGDVAEGTRRDRCRGGSATTPRLAPQGGGAGGGSRSVARTHQRGLPAPPRTEEMRLLAHHPRRLDDRSSWGRPYRGAAMIQACDRGGGGQGGMAVGTACLGMVRHVGAARVRSPSHP